MSQPSADLKVDIGQQIKFEFCQMKKFFNFHRQNFAMDSLEAAQVDCEDLRSKYQASSPWPFADERVASVVLLAK